MSESELELVEGSGNVFRDFGDPQADLRQAKAIIAARIIAVLDERKLPVRKAAEVTGFAAADFARIRNASLGRFTLDRLMKILATLDGRIRVTVHVHHFARLRSMDEADAADAFFDFRVADIAMGSGHFLIAAIDRIEKRMADALAARNLPGVRRELDALRGAAQGALGELATSTTIEDGPLLRRLIARRCIYGVDLNGLSVQLARLSVWIHTFVPGLPLSFLDHNLIHGNSLVGVGTIDEIRKKFEDLDALPLFPLDASSLLGRAAAPLRRLANLNDATLGDISKARIARRDASLAICSTATLCDLIAAQPIADNASPITREDLGNWDPGREDGGFSAIVDRAKRVLDGLHALHFPIAFPEVFLSDRPGFDVILGKLDWYARRFVESHVNYFVFNPFPIPRPPREDNRWRRVVALSGRLACPDDRFRSWADAVGVQSGPLEADEKNDMIHELDSVVAHLYGLTEAQLVHVFETFHEGWDFGDRLDAVLGHFRSWSKRG